VRTRGKVSLFFKIKPRAIIRVESGEKKEEKTKSVLRRPCFFVRGRREARNTRGYDDDDFNDDDDVCVVSGFYLLAPAENADDDDDEEEQQEQRDETSDTKPSGGGTETERFLR